MIPTAPARRILAELGGAVIALALAGIALAHLLGTDRGSFVLSGGDSVFLELAWRSVQDGTPMHWAMSAVLFLFPEFPIYAALRAPAELPQQAMLANALLNLMLLYVLLRLIVRLLRPARHSLLISLAVFAVVVGCVLTESTAQYESFELVSFLLAGTFYYGTVLAMFAAVALTAALLRGLGRPRRAGIIIVAVALFALSALCTLSNPLYILWAGAPLCIALVLVAWRTAVRWWPAFGIAMLIVAGSGLGMLLRLPLAKYASVIAEPYIHPGRSGEAFAFYLRQAKNLLTTPGGVVEFVVLLALSAAAVVAFALVLRRGTAPLPLLVATVGLATPVIVFAVNVALGTESMRYLEPLYFAPLLSLVVLGTIAVEHRAEPAPTRSSWAPVAVATVAGIALVAASVPSFAAIGAVATTPYERAQCLVQWIDGRELTGAGQFWETRDLQAHGGETVEILQVVGGLGAFPWLVDLSRYYDADVSYVIASDAWALDVEEMLGQPAEVVGCGDYSILDYAGTPGEQLLSTAISESAKAYAMQQGLR